MVNRSGWFPVSALIGTASYIILSKAYSRGRGCTPSYKLPVNRKLRPQRVFLDGFPVVLSEIGIEFEQFGLEVKSCIWFFYLSLILNQMWHRSSSSLGRSCLSPTLPLSISIRLMGRFSLSMGDEVWIVDWYQIWCFDPFTWLSWTLQCWEKGFRFLESMARLFKGWISLSTGYVTIQRISVNKTKFTIHQINQGYLLFEQPWPGLKMDVNLEVRSKIK